MSTTKVMLKKANQSMNAGSIQINETAFDSTKSRVGKRPDGQPTPMVDFVSGGKVVATLGVGALSYATLAAENKTVGAALSFGDADQGEFTLPTIAGTIKSIEKDMSGVSSPSIQMSLMKGKKFFQPIISGWRAVDFVKG